MKKGNFFKQPYNKTMASIQLALKFVEEHKEQFKQWIEEKKEKGEIKND